MMTIFRTETNLQSNGAISSIFRQGGEPFKGLVSIYTFGLLDKGIDCFPKWSGREECGIHVYGSIRVPEVYHEVGGIITR